MIVNLQYLNLWFFESQILFFPFFILQNLTFVIRVINIEH